MTSRRGSAVLALWGALAMAAGVIAQVLVHELQPDAVPAPVALGQAVIAVLPGTLATPLILLLGPWAMRLLIVGCGLVLVGLGALASLRARSAAPVYLGVWAAGPLGSLALPAVGGELTPTALAATLAAAVTWLGRPRSPEARLAADAGRRRLLVGAAAGLALAGLAATRVAQGLGSARRAIAGTPLALRRPPEGAGAPVPAADPEAVTTSGVEPDLTPNADFYVVDEAIVDPNVDVDAWRLSIGGLVRQQTALGYDELLGLPAVEQYQTLECISNDVGGPLISNALWTGVPVRTILERAGVGDGATKVIFRSVEGYSSAIPLEVALEPTTLVAFGMNGHALPREHGFPARLLIPGRYGMKMVKWLERIEPTADDYQGFWEQRGWSDDAIVHAMSRIDVPTSIQDLRAGRPAVIAGIAYGGGRGVARVEVSLDGGKSWRDAQLGRRYSAITWRRWAYPWTPDKGFHQLRVRTWDDRGVLQPSDEQPPLPMGATGIHGYQVEVR